MQDYRSFYGYGETVTCPKGSKAYMHYQTISRARSNELMFRAKTLTLEEADVKCDETVFGVDWTVAWYADGTMFKDVGFDKDFAPFCMCETPFK
jgi:hypothetical protein